MKGLYRGAPAHNGGWTNGYSIEYVNSPSSRSRLSCRDCKYFCHEDKSCIKTDKYMPIDGYDIWKNCDVFELDQTLDDFDEKKQKLRKLGHTDCIERQADINKGSDEILAGRKDIDFSQINIDIRHKCYCYYSHTSDDISELYDFLPSSTYEDYQYAISNLDTRRIDSDIAQFIHNIGIKELHRKPLRILKKLLCRKINSNPSEKNGLITKERFEDSFFLMFCETLEFHRAFKEFE